MQNVSPTAAPTNYSLSGCETEASDAKWKQRSQSCTF